MLLLKKSKYYQVLLYILAFYLFAQIFQQLVLRMEPMASASGLEASIIAGQSPLNIARFFLILLSMFLMVGGYLILTLHFYEKSPLLSILSFLFFLFFCLFEIGYRSVELFQVVIVWGREFTNSLQVERALLLAKFRLFNEVVTAIYFPLLFSQLIASICLFVATLKDEFGKLVMIAMAFNTIRLVLRLSGFTPFDYLNIFSGGWYFPPVALIFVLLIWWAFKMRREAIYILSKK